MARRAGFLCLALGLCLCACRSLAPPARLVARLEASAEAKASASASANAKAEANANAEAEANASQIAPRPSPGCRLPPARRTRFEGPRALPRTLSSLGWTRRFLLVLPPDDAAPGPRPLVLNFHGLMESPQLHQVLTRMDDEARARGLVLAYPEGIGLSWNAGLCCGRAEAEQVDDVRFVRDLVAQLGRELCLDERRVYATGMSNGAIFSWHLACSASELIAAIAPVAGVSVDPVCAPAHPVPALAFHGTSDFVVKFDGGRFGLPSVEDTLARASRVNRCEPARDERWKSGDATCAALRGCPSEAELLLCTIADGGHTWPGGTEVPWLGKTSRDLDATRTLLDFFARHARAR